MTLAITVLKDFNYPVNYSSLDGHKGNKYLIFISALQANQEADD